MSLEIKWDESDWAQELYRSFDAKKYVDDKVVALNTYFSKNKIQVAIVGVSGGIDSAVVASILARTNLKHVHLLSMPIYADGASGQGIGETRAINLAKHLREQYGEKIVFNNLDLTKAFKATIESQQIMDGQLISWTRGQMLSAFRIPTMYVQAAYWQQNGFPSVIVGTTNQSEYMTGFWGKYSDGMNDLQIIIDLWKSEVYRVARFLNVPEEIISATPEGGVWNGLSDEELMEFPYWFIEYYFTAFMNGGHLSDMLVSEAKELLLYINTMEERLKTVAHKFLIKQSIWI